jgi:hypothetical protein
MISRFVRSSVSMVVGICIVVCFEDCNRKPDRIAGTRNLDSVVVFVVGTMEVAEESWIIVDVGVSCGDRAWVVAVVEGCLVNCFKGLEDCNRNPDRITGARHVESVVVMVVVVVVVAVVLEGVGEG